MRNRLPLPKTTDSRADWETLKTFLPYVFTYRWRVFLTILCLIAAKLASMGVPIILKELIDNVSNSLNPTVVVTFIPLTLLIAYGALRLLTSFFTEMRELIFSLVTQRTIRTISLKVFEHLHSLSLRFHLNRQTGGLTRDIERGTRSILGIITFALYNIFPTIIEVVLVLGYLFWKYDIWFSLISAVTLVLYFIYTILVTDWRTNLRRAVNELDSKANSKAIDALLNYETVKYFGNENYEAENYDKGLAQLEGAAIKSQKALSILNFGQAAIVTIGITLLLWRATQETLNGNMTLGDLVLINSFMIQLYIPLNFLGVIYREIKQSLADMERLFRLIKEEKEVTDVENAPNIKLRDARVSFKCVNFYYDEERQILFNVDFTIPAGTTCAIVGHSGSGKTTLSRLLFRFYDIQSGQIEIDGQDVRNVTQKSLRQSIGIVPQDTVLFNDTIGFNIAYGKPEATQEEIESAAKIACIHDFIMSLPNGYQTIVGERGLKLSGGEKQRVAIARTVLKNPAILVFDEATSALDTHSEQIIQSQLNEIAKNRTTMIIAHRLSTVIHAQQIIVLDKGRIVERGTHKTLLEKDGLYASMWKQQAKDEEERTNNISSLNQSD